MATLLSPRLDAATKQRPNNAPAAASDGALAKADGLTECEALELAQWLKQSGHASIQLTCDPDRCSVQWRN